MDVSFIDCGIQSAGVRKVLKHQRGNQKP